SMILFRSAAPSRQPDGSTSRRWTGPPSRDSERDNRRSHTSATTRPTAARRRYATSATLFLRTTWAQFSLRNSDNHTASALLEQKDKPSTLAPAAIALIA